MQMNQPGKHFKLSEDKNRNSKLVSGTKGMIQQEDEILQEQGETMFRESNPPVQNQKYPFRK